MNDKSIMLIVDDNYINRQILSNAFCDEYAIEQAQNGVEAIEQMQKFNDRIAIVILDVVMPVMDGMEVLKKTREMPEICEIPIVVVTADTDNDNEINALDLGASDMLSKPYDMRVIKKRISNIVSKRELVKMKEQNLILQFQNDEMKMQEEIRYQAQFDTLTGIYNKDTFYRKTSHLLDKNPDSDFVIIRFDIERFKIVNDLFGMEEGNRLLIYLADKIQEICADNGTYGRLESDNFAICVLNKKNTVDIITSFIKQKVSEYKLSFDIVFDTGVYHICDKSVTVDIMCDRAKLALNTVKGNYLTSIAVYNEKIRDTIIREQEIINAMDSALANEEFCVYLQPKYNLFTSEPVGAEALVRWIRPDKGIVSPGDFIPIYEKCGLITKLDYYIWRKTCELISNCKKEGRTVLPVSVNISRINLYSPDFVDKIENLVKEFNLEPRNLELELTESAYMENPEQLLGIMERLQAKGFVVLMDDFGSGYSSLNMLKNVPVDILKIDMDFLRGTDRFEKGKKILKAIAEMAKDIELPTIVEGVETREQVDFLKAIGCNQAQGYFYAKPMPVDDYLKLIS